MILILLLSFKIYPTKTPSFLNPRLLYSDKADLLSSLTPRLTLYKFIFLNTFSSNFFDASKA